MTNFGWSLPPGCGELPGEGPCICQVCGGDADADKCICPECPECGESGNPSCYKMIPGEMPALIKTQAQIDQMARMEKEWEATNRAEAEFWDSQVQEQMPVNSCHIFNPTWIDRIRHKLFPWVHVDLPELDGGRDGLVIDVDVTLSWVDILRLVISRKLTVFVRNTTENIVGRNITNTGVCVRPPKFLERK